MFPPFSAGEMPLWDTVLTHTASRASVNAAVTAELSAGSQEGQGHRRESLEEITGYPAGPDRQEVSSDHSFPT